VVTAIDV
jgi:hypothetical protein